MSQLQRMISLVFIFFIYMTAFHSKVAQGEVSPYIDYTIQLGNIRHYTQASVFLPLHYSDGSVFVDARIARHFFNHKKNSFNQDAYEANLGLGYRLRYNAETVLGFCGFFDYRNVFYIKKNGFKQLTLNVHSLTPTWQLNANLYLPVGVNKFTKTDKNFTGKAISKNKKISFIYNNQELGIRALRGVDFSFSNVIDSQEKLRTHLHSLS